MASVVVLVDHEVGHILATLKLARALTNLGHRIFYAGPPSAEHLVRNNGFELIPAFQEVHHAPAAGDMKKKLSGSITRVKAPGAFSELIQGKAFAAVIERARPDVVLLNSIQPLEALAIRYRYGIPAILLTISFPVVPRQARCRAVIGRFMELRNGGESELLDAIDRSGIHMKSLEDLAQLASALPELVFLPSSFDFPGEDQEPNLYHIGPFVDLDRIEAPWNWNEHDRPVAFASLGSNSELRPEASRAFFQTVLTAFESMPNWRLIMSIGRNCEISDFGPLPANVTLEKMLPQIRILSHARIALTHAGAGTVKECILLGVPMLLFPLMRDQFECASRVAERGLGLSADIRETRASRIVSMVGQITSAVSYKNNVDNMRRMFESSDNIALAARVIETSISGK